MQFVHRIWVGARVDGISPLDFDDVDRSHDSQKLQLEFGECVAQNAETKGAPHQGPDTAKAWSKTDAESQIRVSHSGGDGSRHADQANKEKACPADHVPRFIGLFFFNLKGLLFFT